MPHVDTPWVGLAALVLMFALPFLPSWLLDGPRVVKHRPRRHVCALCDAPWSEDHVCAAVGDDQGGQPLRGQLQRAAPAALEPRIAPPRKTGNF
jgi:hypothetical protein